MSDALDDAAKKMKNAQQDASAKAETTEDHAKGKLSSVLQRRLYEMTVNSLAMISQRKSRSPRLVPSWITISFVIAGFSVGKMLVVY